MLYRRFGKTNEQVSILGFGCMRLPLVPGGNPSQIDEELAIKLVRHAIDNGVNYVDTAYPYHAVIREKGGASETFLAKALKDGYREKVHLATKLPCFLVKTRSDMDKYLDEQLKKLDTDHIDFYLAHSLNERVWPVVSSEGIDRFFDSAIKDGRIRYAGFSFHAALPLFKEIVDFYDWSFCQIQYNYMDTNLQAGTEGLHYAAQKDLGITIMEPLRGGKLATQMPKEALELIKKMPVNRSAAEWAFRWVWNHPEVSVVLSGMNTMDQVEENLKTASDAQANALTKEELELFDEIKNIFEEKSKVNCTTCGYCMPCPAGVNIPQCFTAYNTHAIFGDAHNYMILQPDQRAHNCVECGKCETQCPQNIHIREQLKAVAETFGNS